MTLSSLANKTVSMDEFTRGFRPWNNIILDWDVDYRGYARGDGPN